MYMLYAFTLFLSATLLFLIQPMFAKAILPELGGTPAVWNTCMVFYQAMLLIGYVYAHLSTAYLNTRTQTLVHLVVLVLPTLVLPVSLLSCSHVPVEANPIPWLLLTLLTSVGLPFFVVSTTAPLLQSWFAETSHPDAQNPYFLYSASNLGSLLALLAYPTVVEPRLGIIEQAAGWSAGYRLLILLVVACVAVLWYTKRRDRVHSCNRSPRAATSMSIIEQKSGGTDSYAAVTQAVRLRWIILSFVPSSLLLGVTTHITTDIASVPLLWVIPLALYLLSFVLVFARHRWGTHDFWVRSHAFILVPLMICFSLGNVAVVWIVLALHLLAFFLASMVCHGELALQRPSASRLTDYYLCMSFGGMLGGMFNSLLAPLVFPTILEYPLILVLGCFLRPDLSGLERRFKSTVLDVVLPLALAGLLVTANALIARNSWSLNTGGLILVSSLAGIACYSFRERPVRFGLGTAAILMNGFIQYSSQDPVLLTERSFFGVLRVRSVKEGHFHQLSHGNTLHGAQCLDKDRRREPLTYYHRQGPIGQVFHVFSGQTTKQRVAAVGLGVGTLACYGESGQQWSFYEIDPAVERIARDKRYFTYLSDSDAEVKVVLGDARRSLAHESDGSFGLIILDAFSSDAIPIHLITREAVRGYLDKLADDGIMAFHISNRHLRLHSVLASVADNLGLECRQQEFRVTDTDLKEFYYPSDWVLMARRTTDFGPLASDTRWRTPSIEPAMRVWTDEYSNILSVLHFGETKQQRQ